MAAISTPFQPSAPASTPDTLITIKIAIDGTHRKFKLPLKDLTAPVLVDKLRSVLQIPANQPINLERFSDSSASFVALTPQNPSSYKQLYRAAKAKLKLRLRATLPAPTPEPLVGPKPDQPESPKTKSKLPTLSNILSPADPSARQTSEKPALTPTQQYVRNFQELLNDIQTAGPSRSTPPADSAKPANDTTLRLPIRPSFNPLNAACWQVCCNNCDKPMSNAHFHCGICDNGDYDLCETCVSQGVLCRGENHWLIKRFIENGTVVTSKTEKLPPKPRPQAPAKEKMPGSFRFETKASEPEICEPRRTCNSCVRVLPERLLVTCKECPDFDLCMSCHKEAKHGHHPGHTFLPTSAETVIDNFAQLLCKPGRHVRHQAICDRCDQSIFGIRHKCLDCPDYDLCPDCIEPGRSGHRHRFVPVYEPIPPGPAQRTRHFGVYCDGPLCKGQPHQGYIQGIRFKCAVCHDTDFCARCEAYPGHTHNKTHPLIMFKTMVRDVSVSTIDSDAKGSTTSLGDTLQQRMARQASTTTLPAYTPPAYRSEQSGIAPDQTRFSTRVEKDVKTGSGASTVTSVSSSAPPGELEACFQRDSVVDGTKVVTGQVFTQRWTMMNKGDQPWPVGCSIRSLGGDNMLNLEPNRPVSIESFSKARESNALEKEVPKGAEVDFYITLRASPQLGRNISYWRLKTADGQPFGPRLWCDIEVVPALDKPSERTAQADFQMQLMLLEQANKRRAMAAREKFETKAQKDDAMVFPKLDKESPTSSMNLEQEAKGKAKEETRPSTSTTATETISDDGELDMKDIESVEFESDEDDGFFTDEEYDILDASDEEIPSSGKA